jgi:phage-related protein (TIGR01555 family)
MDGGYNDSLTNLVSGLGTGRDKAASAAYQLDLSTPRELLVAYKASSLARRVVNLKAEDSCREWREWQGEKDQITMIEREEKRHGLHQKVLRARKMARLFGGSAILIGDGGRDLTKPIEPEKIGRGGLKYLTMLTLLDVSAGGRQEDPTLPGFGGPEYWILRGANRVHPSRLALFHGQEPMYEFGLDANPGFGDSVLRGGLKSVQDVDAAAGNILSLLYEARVDVFKIPDFMQSLAQRGPEYASEVIRRVTLAATAKGINGALLMDAAEEYEQKTANLSGLNKVAFMFMQLCSAAHGYPMTLLFGMSAGGLNASGEIDIRGYYDAVKVEQTLHMEPAMSVLDECLIRSALGDRPEEVHFNWRPLWQPTAKEKAEVADMLVTAGEKLRAMDIISTEALGRAMVNALTESGAFPGLEGANEEFPPVDGPEGDNITL